MADESVMTFTPEEIEDGKGLAWLSYVGWLFLIPLIAKKDNKFCKAHAKQGLVLGVSILLWWIPVVGWIFGVFGLICCIMGLIAAFQGQYKKLPLFGSIAESLKF